MKIFKALILANALSVNANAVNHREKRFISDVLQGVGGGLVDLGQTLEQNWGQVIGSTIQEVVDGILVQFTPVELLQAIHDDWNLFIDQYGPAALFQALHDAKLDLSQIISKIYTDITIEELLQQLNPLYQLNEIVAGLAQSGVYELNQVVASLAQSGSYTLSELASALNGQYPGEFDTFLKFKLFKGRKAEIRQYLLDNDMGTEEQIDAALNSAPYLTVATLLLLPLIL